MVPIHFETFINSADEPGEPERVLRQARAQKNLTEARVSIFQIGEQRVFIAKPADVAMTEH